jgi:hypothetical protein
MVGANRVKTFIGRHHQAPPKYVDTESLSGGLASVTAALVEPSPNCFGSTAVGIQTRLFSMEAPGCFLCVNSLSDAPRLVMDLLDDAPGRKGTVELVSTIS